MKNNHSEEDQSDIDSLYHLGPCDGDGEDLLNGARLKKTPDGTEDAVVISIAIDESVLVSCAVLNHTKPGPIACWALRPPQFLRRHPNLLAKYEKTGQELVVLVGEYIMGEFTIIYFADFINKSYLPTYYVCHPDFPVEYPTSLVESERIEGAIRPLARVGR